MTPAIPKDSSLVIVCSMLWLLPVVVPDYGVVAPDYGVEG